MREEKLDGEQIKAITAQYLHALQANGRIFFQNWAILYLWIAYQ